MMLSILTRDSIDLTDGSLTNDRKGYKLKQSRGEEEESLKFTVEKFAIYSIIIPDQ